MLLYDQGGAPVVSLWTLITSVLCVAETYAHTINIQRDKPVTLTCPEGYRIELGTTQLCRCNMCGSREVQTKSMVEPSRHAFRRCLGKSSCTLTLHGLSGGNITICGAKIEGGRCLNENRFYTCSPNAQTVVDLNQTEMGYYMSPDYPSRNPILQRMCYITFSSKVGTFNFDMPYGVAALDKNNQTIQILSPKDQEGREEVSQISIAWTRCERGFALHFRWENRITQSRNFPGSMEAINISYQNGTSTELSDTRICMELSHNDLVIPVAIGVAVVLCIIIAAIVILLIKTRRCRTSAGPLRKPSSIRAASNYYHEAPHDRGSLPAIPEGAVTSQTPRSPAPHLDDVTSGTHSPNPLYATLNVVRQPPGGGAGRTVGSGPYDELWLPQERDTSLYMVENNLYSPTGVTVKTLDVGRESVGIHIVENDLYDRPDNKAKHDHHRHTSDMNEIIQYDHTLC